jgi:cell wall-associated NlpC family hydrolase
VDSRLTELFQAKFVNGGRDVNTGLDCQGLFLKVMSLHGHNVKDTDVASYATEVVASTIAEELQSGKWKKIDKPEVGCAVVIALDSFAPEKAQHLGVYIGEGQFVHMLEKRGVVVNRINDRFFQQKIRGYWAWNG